MAETLGGEIISCDSMQVYRGLDIGTAKPDLRTRNRVRHHFIDILDIHAPFSAGVFSEEVERVLADLNSRGRPGVLVGGTGLYARAVIYGLSNRPGDWRISQEVWAEHGSPGGPERLRTELATAAPGHAALTEPNPRRLMRAVAVLRMTGHAPTSEQPSDRPNIPKPGFAQWVILPTMDVLRERIANRTRAMLAAGWIEETQRLVQAGLLDTPTAKQALGYRDIADYIKRPHSERSLEELLTVLCRRTTAYARRQRTWFRHQHPGSRTIEVSDAATTSADLAKTIRRELQTIQPHPA
ncbi:MAG: tRNA (adenosine(37)-N6)-dimethylallyltransferase MiaA [Lentisphaerae bacterium RIFOXYA12_64_32]|nr:MAG: tRNA (adenosine(37)-N6)-dimethylallyltransferase MiaA [Lentisphaerae bacterium RIFOXYA12_64_32]